MLKPPPLLKRSVSDEELRRILQENRLYGVSIRIPSPCNLDCLYCYGTKEKFKELIETGKALTFEEIKSIIDQLYSLGGQVLSIVGDGEPLLNPRIFDIIDYANSTDISVVLFTNNTTITPDIAQILHEKDIAVIAKQNSLNRATQNTICGREWAYDKLTKGLQNLIDVGFTQHSPSRLAINTVIIKPNYAEIPNMWVQWRKQNIIPFVQVYVPHNNTLNSELYVEPKEVKRLFEELLRIDKEQFGYTWDPVETYPIAAMGCSIVLSSLGIGPNGDVFTCSYTEDKVGNIRRDTLEHILESEKVRRIRQFHYCPKSLHYGCRALTFRITGDRFAPDPFYKEFKKTIHSHN
jgi:radical SAM protein with 4Fe4S-binding SPASM domain